MATAVRKFNTISHFLRGVQGGGQIVRPVNLILLPNQKTSRNCKDSFKILSNRATKYVSSYYDLGSSLGPLKRVLVQHGVLQARRT